MMCPLCGNQVQGSISAIPCGCEGEYIRLQWKCECGCTIQKYVELYDRNYYIYEEEQEE